LEPKPPFGLNLCEPERFSAQPRHLARVISPCSAGWRDRICIDKSGGIVHWYPLVRTPNR
jgi:hypothetical protein